MRVLFTTLPGVGHLHPLLPVARGLIGCGHDVLVAASPAFGPAVSSVGLAHAPVGGAWTTNELPMRFPDVGAIPPGPARYRYARAAIFARALPLEPANVHVESWIPQAAVLPHCAAVVTHGGYGTVAAALAAGRPVVLLPISADQPSNAERCAAAGVGLKIGPDERTPSIIRGAVRTVLDRAHYSAAARVAGAVAASQPDLDHALDLLEALAAHRRRRFAHRR